MRKLALVTPVLILVSAAAWVAQCQPLNTKIDKLFRLDMLNSNIDYIEHITGPTKYKAQIGAVKDAESRTYIVDGCKVEIVYQNGSVRNMGIDGIYSRCRFPLARFIPHTPKIRVTELDQLTFGGFNREVGRRIDENRLFVECLASCGNSADPSISLFHTCAHVDEFVDILVENDYPYADKDADGALGKLENILLKSEPQDYLSYGKVACDGKYQRIEWKLFEAIKIKKIYVGYDLETLLPKCDI